MSDAPALLPVSHLIRPERQAERPGVLDRMAHGLAGHLHLPAGARVRRARRLARRVLSREAAYRSLDEAALRERALDLRQGLARRGFRSAEVVEAFALVREVSGRALGMRHFESQLVGGLLLLRGMVAEMATGEGKTLTATLPACVAALAGVPVHLVSVNDYLTTRDAEWMGPVYRALGLTVGCVAQGMEPAARRRAYACQVTYCTNKELVFDYLKDQLVLAERAHHLRLEADRLSGRESRSERLLLRGLHFAIVDEVDSVLVDEARTPLIISGAGGGNGQEEEILRQALGLAGSLRQGEHFEHDPERRHLDLTDQGRLHLEDAAADLGPYWRGRVRREETARMALSALYQFARDQHYLVRDDKVQIIDELTGRVMADRSWERGLHQLIELKEGCTLTEPREPLARISYQRFFRNYHHLAGMTGTAREIRGELWSVYGLRVAPVPLHRPSRRRRAPVRVLRREQDKWAAVVARIGALHRGGRPVLVGTSSVAASETLSQLLAREGLAHRVLNAKQDGEEAAIVADAGQPGRITVATSMAGRGTDIKLAPEVAAGEGLHVILTERHEAGRIDRQLEGRCARQGDPGSFEVILSLEDPLVRDARGGLPARLARLCPEPAAGLRGALGRWATARAQRRLERIHARLRRRLLDHDQRQADMLAFSGRRL